MAAKRDWSAAVAKVRDEGACRNCGTTDRLDPAHIVPRSRITVGAEDPRNIVPLCRRCHDAQHDGRLRFGGLLTRDEQTYIVELVGLEEAHRRTA